MLTPQDLGTVHEEELPNQNLIRRDNTPICIQVFFLHLMYCLLCYHIAYFEWSCVPTFANVVAGGDRALSHPFSASMKGCGSCIEYSGA
jgi:hypothetical protein